MPRFWKRHEAHVKEIRLQNIAAQTGVPQARPGRAAKPLQQQLAELDPNADPAETAKKPWTRWVFMKLLFVIFYEDVGFVLNFRVVVVGSDEKRTF